MQKLLAIIIIFGLLKLVRIKFDLIAQTTKNTEEELSTFKSSILPVMVVKGCVQGYSSLRKIIATVGLSG